MTGKDVIDKGLDQNVFYKQEDTSVWIDLEKDGLDKKLLLRSDGTAVYITQDIGTAYQRFLDYPNLSGMVYTVGNEQDYHFKVLFLILKKLGFSWADACYHLSYGMVDLPSGKMKSREGTVVDADDLIERGHLQGMNEIEKDSLYHLIGKGALAYFLLKVDPKKRMLFNPDESVELNGNTGPFIQYTHARIKSLLRKNNENIEINHCECTIEEKELIKLLTAFPEHISQAAHLHSPYILAQYLYDLSKEYNSFYQNLPILNESEQSHKHLRLSLSIITGRVIEKGMKLLGIDVPERM